MSQSTKHLVNIANPPEFYNISTTKIKKRKTKLARCISKYQSAIRETMDAKIRFFSMSVFDSHSSFYIAQLKRLSFNMASEPDVINFWRQKLQSFRQEWNFCVIFILLPYSRRLRRRVLKSKSMYLDRKTSPLAIF